MTSLDNLQVFYREATAVRTEVVAYLADAAGDTLRGHVDGPLAGHAKTLPFRTPFETSGVGGGGVMSRAIVNETCFWEPGAPHWYVAKLSLCRGDEVIDECERVVGVRPLAVTIDGLRLNGRPHVLRAVSATEISDDARALCLNEKMTLAVDDVTDSDLAMASETGLPLIAQVGGTAAEVTSELRRLARWPAVMLAIVDSSEQLPESLQLECPNMLLGEVAVKGRPPADWAHLAIVDSASSVDLGRLSVPVITRLKNGEGGTLSERIAAAGTFDPDPDEEANHGQVVGCIV